MGVKGISLEWAVPLSLYKTTEQYMEGSEVLSIVQVVGSITVGALGCFLLLLLWWIKNRSSTSSTSPHLPLPPGTFGFLWLGETFKFFYALRAGATGTFVRERTSKFGSKTFKTQIAFQSTVVVQGVAANRFVAAGENKQELLNSWPAWILKVLGEHVPVAKHGAPHRRLRQIMTSCLGPVALQKLVGRVDLLTHLHVESCWKAYQSQPLFLLSLIQQHTFCVACRLLAGIEDEARMEWFYTQFKIWLQGLVSFPLDLPGTSLRRAKNAKKMLVLELGKIFDRKLQITAEKGDEDLLGIMLKESAAENGSFLNQEELPDVILFLLFAGYDTTTGTLSFVLKFLEQNPDCYHRLLQEHEAIASQKKRGERLNWEDVQNMKYTWAVIQETLSLRNITIGGFKEAKHDIDFEGYRIPQGWKMFYDITSTHFDEQFFPNPHKFDPSRFETNKQEGNGPPSYAFVPFGIGPHSCPGNEFARLTMSIYLYHLAIRHFKWKSIYPNEKVHMLPSLKLAMNYPAKIFIERQP